MHIENYASAFQGRDVVWVPLELKFGGVSIPVYDQWECPHLKIYRATSGTKIRCVKV
jgi:hypothetical protein